MMFYHSVSAMANNRSIIDSFANKMGWSVEHGAAAIAAYATGLYLPTLEEVKALSNLPDFENEWRLALYAFHVLELQRRGADLSTLAKPETVAKWVRGTSLLKCATRLAMLHQFNTDVDTVPEGRRFVYANDERPKIVFDSRRNQLLCPGWSFPLAQVHATMYVFKAKDEADLMDFVRALDEHGILTIPSGEFIRAVIPATSVSIYYAKP